MMITLRRLRWTGLVAHMEKKRNVYRVLVGKCKGQRQLGRCGKMMLKLILKKRDTRAWIGFIWLRIGTCGTLI